jgi:hypothetical protein
MAWEVRPLIGVGPLAFGISRADVRHLLGEASRLFRKGPERVQFTDEFAALGVHLYYDVDDRLEFVEGWNEPTATGWRPEWNGVRFFELGLHGTLNALRQLGVDAVDDSLGDYDCWDIGVSLYAPSELEGVACYSASYRRTLRVSRGAG